MMSQPKTSESKYPYRENAIIHDSGKIEIYIKINLKLNLDYWLTVHRSITLVDF
jgi:hypothetical protein